MQKEESDAKYELERDEAKRKDDERTEKKRREREKAKMRKMKAKGTKMDGVEQSPKEKDDKAAKVKLKPNTNGGITGTEGNGQGQDEAVNGSGSEIQSFLEWNGFDMLEPIRLCQLDHKMYQCRGILL